MILSTTLTTPLHPTPGPLDHRPTEAARITHAFHTAAKAEIDRNHAAGLPYSTLTPDGRLVFVHPDGSRRLGRDLTSPLA